MNYFTPAENTENYAKASVVKANLPIAKMLVLGVLAGFLIAFPSCVTDMATFAYSNTSLTRTLSGLLFAFGLGMVIIGGAELFTGNTLMIIALLDKRIALRGMLKNWCFVFLGNFIGTMAVSLICANFGWLSAGESLLAADAMSVAVAKMTMPFQNAFFMGVLCNILVTMGVLLSMSSKDNVGRFLGAWCGVMFFVTCGFNHSIADMTYCMLGLFATNNPDYVQTAVAAGVNVESLTWGNYLMNNLIPVTLGNLVGGLAVGTTYWFSYLRGTKK